MWASLNLDIGVCEYTFALSLEMPRAFVAWSLDPEPGLGACWREVFWAWNSWGSRQGRRQGRLGQGASTGEGEEGLMQERENGGVADVGRGLWVLGCQRRQKAHSERGRWGGQVS